MYVFTAEAVDIVKGHEAGINREKEREKEKFFL